MQSIAQRHYHYTALALFVKAAKTPKTKSGGVPGFEFLRIQGLALKDTLGLIYFGQATCRVQPETLLIGVLKYDKRNLLRA